MSKIESYEKAYEELDEILQALENESVSVDDLAKKVERAALLLKYCKEKLRSTEEKVMKIVSDSD